jgi:hypothetical protein
MQNLGINAFRLFKSGGRRKSYGSVRRRLGGVLSPQEFANSLPEGHPGKLIVEPLTKTRRIGNMYGRRHGEIPILSTPTKLNNYYVTAPAETQQLLSRQASNRISFPPRTARNTARSNHRNRRNRRNRRSRRH